MVEADADSARAAATTWLLPDELVHQLEDRLALEQAEARLPSLVAGLARDGILLWWGAEGSGGLAGGQPASVTDAIPDRFHFKNVHRCHGHEVARRG